MSPFVLLHQLKSSNYELKYVFTTFNCWRKEWWYKVFDHPQRVFFSLSIYYIFIFYLDILIKLAGFKKGNLINNTLKKNPHKTIYWNMFYFLSFKSEFFGLNWWGLCIDWFNCILKSKRKKKFKSKPLIRL